MSRIDIVLGGLALLTVALSQPGNAGGSASHHQLSGFQPIFNQGEVVHKKKGAVMRKYMNFSASPCDDFYAFACGNYERESTPLDELNAKVDDDLQRILQAPAKVHDHFVDGKLKNFYKSCQAVSRHGPLQQEFFSAFIKNHSGFPAVPGTNWLEHQHSYNWVEVIAKMRHNFGLDILIGLRVDLNVKNTNENSIYLGEPRSTLIPAELCHAEATRHTDLQDRAYEPVEKAAADNLRLWLSLDENEATRVAADIVTFEFELCKARGLNLTTANYTRKSLTEFTTQLNHGVDLYSYVSTSFHAPYYQPVFMTSEPYFRQLVKTVGDHNLTTIANYIMYRALATFNFPRDDNAPVKRNKYCLDVLKRYLPAAVGDMYNRHYESSFSKDQVERMFLKVKNAFMYTSLRNVWIEEGTARVGKEKLSQISLAFPSYNHTHFARLQLNAGNYWHNLAEVMALVAKQQLIRLLATDQPEPSDALEAYETRLSYTPWQRRVDIGWGLLRSPFYEQLQPLSLSYATIGQQLGTVLAGAFDDQSWTADSLDISNWDRQTEREYHSRSECFRSQLSNYLHNNPDTFRNASTVRQLIAASGGLNVAFSAYLDWLFFMNPNNDFVVLSKETLPEVNYTNTQLFFIAFAQMQCKAVRRATKTRAKFSPLIAHTMHRYAVNGPLQHSPEFGREFGCRTGTEMNPVVKCVIY